MLKASDRTANIRFVLRSSVRVEIVMAFSEIPAHRRIDGFQHTGGESAQSRIAGTRGVAGGPELSRRRIAGAIERGVQSSPPFLRETRANPRFAERQKRPLPRRLSLLFPVVGVRCTHRSLSLHV